MHITVGQPPVVRLHGRMRRLETKVLEADDTMALMKSITPDRCQQELQTVGGSDFGFAFGDSARFRVSVFKQRGQRGHGAAADPQQAADDGAAGAAQGLRRADHAAARIVPGDRADRLGQEHVAGQHDQLSQRERSITTSSRSKTRSSSTTTTRSRRSTSGRSASTCRVFPRRCGGRLRQDPDVILVGEMRDLETIEAAITAAETGHVVFGTLHTTGAQGTVNRIIDVFPTNQQEQIRTQLSTSIIGVLSQALLPKIGGGRVAAYEMLVVTPAIGNLIRENKTFRITSAIQTGAKFGMILMDDSLFSLWRDGKCRQGGGAGQGPQPGRAGNLRIAKAERGIFEDEEGRRQGGTAPRHARVGILSGSFGRRPEPVLRSSMRRDAAVPEAYSQCKQTDRR